MRAQEISILPHWMGQYLFQQEVLLEGECWIILDLWDENIPKEVHILKGLHITKKGISQRE